MDERTGPNIDPIEIYKQQYAHFGRMNEILYKLPVLYATLVGALWYVALTQFKDDRVIAVGVLLFAAVLCWSFIITTQRFRQAFSRYLDNINRFDGEFAVTLPRDKLTTVRTIITVVWAALFLSVAAAIHVATPLLKLLCSAP